MEMISINIDGMTLSEYTKLGDWMMHMFGKPGVNTWWIDDQPLMTDLVCTKEIATVVILRWK